MKRIVHHKSVVNPLMTMKSGEIILSDIIRVYYYTIIHHDHKVEYKVALIVGDVVGNVKWGNGSVVDCAIDLAEELRRAVKEWSSQELFDEIVKEMKENADNRIKTLFEEKNDEPVQS